MRVGRRPTGVIRRREDSILLPYHAKRFRKAFPYARRYRYSPQGLLYIFVPYSQIYRSLDASLCSRPDRHGRTHVDSEDSRRGRDQPRSDFPARHPAPSGAHSSLRQLLWANDPVSVTGTIGEALPGHKQSSPGDETESESPGFVNDRVSSMVLRGPRTLTLAIPLTHEHGW